ncbi:MAG: TIGR00374 family protein [Alphaproteobacteria bacterium]|nr:TIGR00374 family protein [Alphaproteobacteria bacterium]
MRVGLLIGLAIVILLVGWQGVTTMADRLAGAGWAILLVALFIPPDLILRAASFQLLFLRGRAPRFADTALAMWIGSSVNFLLPVATVGGEFVKARILTLRSVTGVDAAASVVLDKTVQALSILIWAIIGTVILAVVTPSDEPMVLAAVTGAGLLALGIGGFVVVQYAGAFGLFARPAARVSRSDTWQSLVESAADLDQAIRALYRQPIAVTVSTILRVAKRAVMAGEVWLVAWLLDHPIGWEEAIMLNSLALALRSAAFAVPGGLGVQEGGYIMLGALIGLPPDVMLAISLATRLGELIEGLPGLVAWQVTEGGNYWHRRRKASPQPPSC